MLTSACSTPCAPVQAATSRARGTGALKVIIEPQHMYSLSRVCAARQSEVSASSVAREHVLGHISCRL